MLKNPIPPIPQKNFFKVWFGNHREFTTGLVLNKHKHGTMTIRELSRLFAVEECLKMQYFYRSVFFKSYEEAINAIPADAAYIARINP